MALSAVDKTALEAELVDVEAAIKKALKSQSYSTSSGNSVTRQDLSALYKRKGQIKKMLKGNRFRSLI